MGGMIEVGKRWGFTASVARCWYNSVASSCAQTLWAKGNKHELCPIDLLAEVEREKRMYLKVGKKRKSKA